MPYVRARSRKTREVYRFMWDGPKPPTDEEIDEVIAVLKEKGIPPIPEPPESIGPPEPPPQEIPQWKKTASSVGRGVAELGGLTAGSMLGGPIGLLGGPAGVKAGQVTGASLGFAMGKKAADVWDAALGIEIPDFEEGIKETPGLLKTGAMMEMTGQGSAKAIGYGLKKVGQAGAAVMGRLSGEGTPTIKHMAQRSATTRAALRGNIPGLQIVENVNVALGKIKERRATEYVAKLGPISQNKKPIDMTPISRKLNQLINDYHISVNPKSGKVDVTFAGIGDEGRAKILKTIKMIKLWDKRGDKTPVGLDALKRYLDDSYSESSQAKQFIQSMKDTVRSTIEKDVPEYREMTRGYNQMSDFIREVESSLLSRKKGWGNQLIADNTLRKLMKTMRKDPELGKDIIDQLGAQTGQELTDQITGYMMRSLTPVGPLGTGPVIIAGMGLAKFLGPAFYPVLMLSSPRVAGEFLQLLGGATSIGAKVGPYATRYGAYEAMKQRRDKFEESKE